MSLLDTETQRAEAVISTTGHQKLAGLSPPMIDAPLAAL